MIPSPETTGRITDNRKKKKTKTHRTRRRENKITFSSQQSYTSRELSKKKKEEHKINTKTHRTRRRRRRNLVEGEPERRRNLLGREGLARLVRELERRAGKGLRTTFHKTNVGRQQYLLGCVWRHDKSRRAFSCQQRVDDENRRGFRWGGKRYK